MAFVEKPENVSGNSKVYGNSKVCFDAEIKEQKNIRWLKVKGRTGVYIFTMFTCKDKNFAWTWGCKEGKGKDSLKEYFANNEGYEQSTIDLLLGVWESFKKANT